MNVNDFRITDNKNESVSYSGVRINYSTEEISGSVQIIPCGLLEENNIRPVKPDLVKRQDVTGFFPVENSIIPFDLFSSIFWLLSRHEEYTCTTRDLHDRFPVAESVLFKENLLQRPIVEEQIRWFEKVLSNHFSHYTIAEKKPVLLLTVDIDHAWAFKNKSPWVKTASWLKTLVSFNLTDLKNKIRVARGKEKDPYDTYDDLMFLLNGKTVSKMMFFLLANRSKFDRNISYNHPEMVRLIQRMSENFSIGIHPGYASHLNQEAFNTESQRLSLISGEKNTRSRFHYLRFKLPQSYRIAQNAGIREEHSMGHAADTGFRAGTCFPFYFYDLEEEKQGELLVYPMHIMDGTLNEYLRLTPEQAKLRSRQLWDEVVKYGGFLSVLWHNETINDSSKWKGWKDVLEFQLNLPSNSACKK